jgi:hypothetical protein
MLKEKLIKKTSIKNPKRINFIFYLKTIKKGGRITCAFYLKVSKLKNYVHNTGPPGSPNTI